MARPLVPNELWELLAPLLPAKPSKPRGGRPRVRNRAALTGILFVLKSGIPWEMLPQEMGCSSGMTYWRRLRNWLAAGVWDDLHLVLLDRLELADHIDWSQASLDSGSVPAPGGPTNRAQPNGSRPIGLEAPTGGRPWRYPIGDQAYSGKPPRFIDAGDDD